ncbi:rhodanese-like domain-containing protein [Pseudorhizobium sp. NPDC055634]
MQGSRLVILFAILLALLGGRTTFAEVKEPEGIWTGAMRGETPQTLQGASVVDLSGLETLLPQDPVLLDVGPADRKPEGFSEDRLWLPTHRSLPNAVWLPGAGAPALEPGREKAFFDRVEELTQGDRARPIVVFCQPRCWGSWNAGKRLVTQGYTGVHWYPGGVDGWQEKHETVAVDPDKGWPVPPAN